MTTRNELRRLYRELERTGERFGHRIAARSEEEQAKLMKLSRLTKRLLKKAVSECGGRVRIVTTPVSDIGKLI